MPSVEPAKRRGKDRTVAQIQLVVDDQLRGPELEGREHYQPETLRWYESWRRSPQASQFTGPEWMRLEMLAPLVDSLYAIDPDNRPSITSRLQIIGELRLQEQKLGATAEDRLRLRWKLPASGETTGADGAPTSSAPASSSRRRADPRVAAAPPKPRKARKSTRPTRSAGARKAAKKK